MQIAKIQRKSDGKFFDGTGYKPDVKWVSEGGRKYPSEARARNALDTFITFHRKSYETVVLKETVYQIDDNDVEIVTYEMQEISRTPFYRKLSEN